MSDRPVARTGRVIVAGRVLDLDRRILFDASGALVDLRPQALELLCMLAQRAGEVIDKHELLNRIWPGMIVTDDSLVQAISDIRRVIGDEGHHVVQTVPRRGYRLTVSAPVPAPETGSAVPVPAAAKPPTPVPAAAEPPASAVSLIGRSEVERPRTARIAAWAIVLLVLTGVVAAWQPWRLRVTALAAATPDRPPIAVLDFSDPAAPVEDQQMARAYAEELTGELARNADLSVIAAHSSFAAGARGEGLSRVAERLGVGYLVTGTLRHEGERLRLLVQMVDGRDSRVVWTERHDVMAAQIYTVRDALVQRIAGSLQSTMRGNQEVVVMQRPPASLDIYAMTMRAITLKHRFTPKDSAQAHALLERVVALDPQYAPGWLYLGYVNGIDYAQAFSGPRRPELLRLAIEQIERSVALDPRLSAAYGALSNFLPFAGRHDDAVRAGQRCMELAPSDAECMIFLAGALVVAGQAQNALPLARRAMAMNPLAPSYVQASYGRALLANGLLDEALLALDACVSAAPRNSSCRLDRVIARTEAGRLDEALEDLAEWQRKVGPQLKPEVAVISLYGPKARALIERRMAALKLLQSRALVAAKP